MECVCGKTCKNRYGLGSTRPRWSVCRKCQCHSVHPTVPGVSRWHKHQMHTEHQNTVRWSGPKIESRRSGSSLMKTPIPCWKHWTTMPTSAWESPPEQQPPTGTSLKRVSSLEVWYRSSSMHSPWACRWSLWKFKLGGPSTSPEADSHPSESSWMAWWWQLHLSQAVGGSWTALKCWSPGLVWASSQLSQGLSRWKKEPGKGIQLQPERCSLHTSNQQRAEDLATHGGQFWPLWQVEVLDLPT